MSLGPGNVNTFSSGVEEFGSALRGEVLSREGSGDRSLLADKTPRETRQQQKQQRISTMTVTAATEDIKLTENSTPSLSQPSRLNHGEPQQDDQGGPAGRVARDPWGESAVEVDQVGAQGPHQRAEGRRGGPPQVRFDLARGTFGRQPRKRAS